jgi:acyl-CoA synthetase (AMP-forming)/AMP-acid ligase II
VIRRAPWPANLGAIHLPSVGAGAPAIVDLAGDAPATWSYDALDDRASRIAGGLVGRGIGPGDRVGILGENSAGWLAAFLAILRVGAVVVPLNARLPDGALRSFASTTRLAATLADPAHRGRIDGARDLADPPIGDPVPVADVVPSDTALILSTSGSTGLAKGVVCSHRSLVAAVVGWASWSTSATMERTIVAAPLFHKNGLGEAKVALALGASVVLMARFDARAYLEAAAAHRCTTLSGVPTMFARMLAQDDLIATLDLSAVRGINVGSAPFTEELAARVHEVFPHATVFNSYGTTEVPSIFGDHPDGLAAPRTTVGVPLAGTPVRLVGPDGADANPGELWAGGDAVMDAYLDLPEETAEKLADGMVRTGDVMRRDEHGFFHFVGRVDDMFVSGGDNVYPGAVVQVLEGHPAIRQAAVVAVPDEERGAVPVAFVVADPAEPPTESDVQAWALAHAPASHHPRAVWFVDALPLGDTEKVDVRALETEARRRRAEALGSS